MWCTGEVSGSCGIPSWPERGSSSRTHTLTERAPLHSVKYGEWVWSSYNVKNFYTPVPFICPHTWQYNYNTLRQLLQFPSVWPATLVSSWGAITMCWSSMHFKDLLMLIPQMIVIPTRHNNPLQSHSIYKLPF